MCYNDLMILIKRTGGDNMLNIIKGAFNSERDKAFCDAVRRAQEEHGNVLVIMPDQYSFECDKKLYSALGAKAFNSIETAGFNRLAELISHKYGKCAYENADANIRLIMMFMAVEQFRNEKECRYYKRSLGKGRFIGEMIDLVTELIRSGITPEDLRIASERLEGSVTSKLFDISRIYSLYLEDLEKHGMRDSFTALADALLLAKDNGYFKGRSVFLDGFTSFSYDELGFIGAMLSQHADVTVSLLGYKQGKTLNLDAPFAATLRTESALLGLARDNNCSCTFTELDGICGAHDTILAIDRYYCTGERLPKEAAKTAAEGITVAAANDIYDELEYVCAEIERLVSEEGYSYSEIAVAARDLGTCAAAAESSFERFGIPYFSDRRVRADSSVTVIFLKNLFECLLPQKYHTDDILRLIKSPLFPLNDIEITNLEDHCVIYNIDGDMWLEPFCAHDKKHDVPSTLEDIRKKIIEPLERFRTAAADSTAEGLCDALFALLEEIEFSKQVYSVVRRCAGSDNETQLEFVRSSRQIWQSVFSAVKTIHDELGNRKITLKRFFELFKLMTSKMNISSPPQKLEAVRLADAESSRLDNVRVLFVIEMNERVFPAAPVHGGLFTEREKQQMSAADIAVSGTALQSAENERLVVYRTLCLAKEKLYALYSETNTAGKTVRRSMLIDKLTELFGGISPLMISKLPLDSFCTSFGTAYYKYLEHSKELLVPIDRFNDDTPDKARLNSELRRNADIVASVEKALEGSPDHASRLAALPSYKYDEGFSVRKKTARELFCTDKLTLSPTNINSYYTCPFSFFCKYGLKLRNPQSIRFDPLTKGNYLHRCLESLMTKEENGERVYNKNFVMFTEEQLKEKISAAFLVYEAEEIGGSYGKTPSFIAQRDKYEQTVFEMVKLIQEEFSSSAFEPAFFEYKLEQENGESLLELKLSDELTVKVVGSIDRADVFTDTNGKKYFRIIDYKTGNTTFDLDKLYHGLNMQLLIYLLAMTDSREEALPAAVLYSHLKEPEAKLDPPAVGEDPNTYAQWLKTIKPDGLIVDNAAVIAAFNTDHGGAFMPIRINNDGGIAKTGKQPVEEAFLKGAEEFVKRKIISLAERLMNGEVPASPVMSKKYDPCTKCDHYDICGRVLRGDPLLIDKSDKDKLLEEVAAITKEMKRGDC